MSDKPSTWHSRGVDNYNITGNEWPLGYDPYLETRQEALHKKEKNKPRRPDPLYILKEKKVKDKIKQASTTVDTMLKKIAEEDKEEQLFKIWGVTLEKILKEDYQNSQMDKDTWKEAIFSGNMPDAAKRMLQKGDDIFGMEVASETFKDIVDFVS